jgi:hypothetical protein
MPASGSVRTIGAKRQIRYRRRARRAARRRSTLALVGDRHFGASPSRQAARAARARCSDECRRPAAAAGRGRAEPQLVGGVGADQAVGAVGDGDREPGLLDRRDRDRPVGNRRVGRSPVAARRRRRERDQAEHDQPAGVGERHRALPVTSWIIAMLASTAAATASMSTSPRERAALTAGAHSAGSGTAAARAAAAPLSRDDEAPDQARMQ